MSAKRGTVSIAQNSIWPASYVTFYPASTRNAVQVYIMWTVIPNMHTSYVSPYSSTEPKCGLWGGGGNEQEQEKADTPSSEKTRLRTLSKLLVRLLRSRTYSLFMVVISTDCTSSSKPSITSVMSSTPTLTPNDHPR